MLRFEKEVHQDRLRIIAAIQYAVCAILISYFFFAGSIGVRVIERKWDLILTGLYILETLLFQWAVRRWKGVLPAVLLGGALNMAAITGIVWRWGGVTSLGLGHVVLPPLLSALLVGPAEGLLVVVVQGLMLFAVARIDGVPIFGLWLVLYLGLTGIGMVFIYMVHRFLQQQESKLRAHGERLEADRSELQASVERLVRISQAQVDSLIRAERLATIGMLAPTIVHDLKNPLGALASVAETSRETLGVVLAEKPDNRVAEVRDDLKVVREQLIRLKDMVQGILNLARQDEGYAEDVDLNAAARDALVALRLQTKTSKLTVEEKLSGGALPVRGNQGQLAQVIVNLLWNAAQAIGEAPGIVRLSTRAQDGSVIAEVSDSGPGIAAEVRGRLFEPFVTTKKAGQGTGLGLYLCREIVSRHGGSVEAGKSALGGASFTVRIPAGPGGR